LILVKSDLNVDDLCFVTFTYKWVKQKILVWKSLFRLKIYKLESMQNQFYSRETCQNFSVKIDYKGVELILTCLIALNQNWFASRIDSNLKLEIVAFDSIIDFYTQICLLFNSYLHACVQ